MSTRLHPRAKRLESLRQMAEAAEKDALAEFGKAQQTLQAQHQQLETLHEYANDYRQRLATPDSTLSSGNVQSTLVFIGQIETGIVAQKEQVALWQTRVETLQGEYLAARSKTASLEALMDKLDGEYLDEQARQEQRQMDEWSSQMAFRRQSERSQGDE